MDISGIRRYRIRFKDLWEGISKSPGNHPLSKESSEVLKVLQGASLLVLALALGWFAKMETERVVRYQILETEWPPTPVWNAVLQQGGWKRVHSDFSNLLKDHPNPYSSDSVLWESQDHCWLFRSGEPELWTCASGQKAPRKMKWNKIGAGYAALAKVAQTVLPKPKKAASYIDPKEIRY